MSVYERMRRPGLGAGEPFEIGNYAAALPIGGSGTRQGLIIDHRSDGVVVLLGEAGVYYCYDDAVTVVPDRNLWGSTKAFVAREREARGLGGGR